MAAKRVGNVAAMVSVLLMARGGMAQEPSTVTAPAVAGVRLVAVQDGETKEWRLELNGEKRDRSELARFLRVARKDDRKAIPTFELPDAATYRVFTDGLIGCAQADCEGAAIKVGVGKVWEYRMPSASEAGRNQLPMRLEDDSPGGIRQPGMGDSSREAAEDRLPETARNDGWADPAGRAEPSTTRKAFELRLKDSMRIVVELSLVEGQTRLRVAGNEVKEPAEGVFVDLHKRVEAAKVKNTMLILRADGQTPMGEVMAVIRAAEKAGFASPGFQPPVDGK